MRLCAVEEDVAGAEPLGDRLRALGDEVDDLVGGLDPHQLDVAPLHHEFDEVVLHVDVAHAG